MVTLTNLANFSTVIPLTGGGHHTLAPGQTDNLDAAMGHRVLQAWIANARLQVTQADEEIQDERKPRPKRASNRG